MASSLAIPVVYILHSGEMFGTERMALATLDGLNSTQSIIVTPPGLIVREAKSRGHAVITVKNQFQLLRAVESLLRKNKELVFLTTTVLQAAVIHTMNLVYRRRISHLQLVHGGSDEFSSYGRKKLLNQLGVSIVAVSEFVREKLIEHGVRSEKIHVVGNFLSEKTVGTVRQRKQITTPLKGNGLLVSRLVPQKRIELLFDAIGQQPALREYQFDIFGSGDLMDRLQAKVQKDRLPVKFFGYVPDVASRFADYEFLVHLNPEEPFGLVVLEAMAAGVPVLVPDQGGAATIVRNRENGFLFQSNDAADLAKKLLELRELEPLEIETIIANARADVKTEFSSKARIAAYRKIIADSFIQQ